MQPRLLSPAGQEPRAPAQLLQVAHGQTAGARGRHWSPAGAQLRVGLAGAPAGSPPAPAPWAAQQPQLGCSF